MKQTLIAVAILMVTIAAVGIGMFAAIRANQAPSRDDLIDALQSPGVRVLQIDGELDVKSVLSDEEIGLVLQVVAGAKRFKDLPASTRPNGFPPEIDFQLAVTPSRGTSQFVAFTLPRFVWIESELHVTPASDLANLQAALSARNESDPSAAD